MKDILPKEMAIRDYVIRLIKETYGTFGFTSMETPCVEHIENLNSKQGGENDFAWVQTFTSFQSSEKFLTASMMRSTTAPIAWKIGPSAIMRIASFQSICI